MDGAFMFVRGDVVSDRIKSIESGDHILAIYQDKDGEYNEAFQFLKDGLEKGETIMIIADNLSHDEILKRMEHEWKIDAKEFEKSGIIEIRTTDQWYFHHGFPDAEKFKPFWPAMTEMARMRGRNGLRVFCDTANFFEGEYSNEFVAYESTLPKKFQASLTTVCAYQSKDVQKLTRQQYNVLSQHHNIIWT